MNFIIVPSRDELIYKGLWYVALVIYGMPLGMGEYLFMYNIRNAVRIEKH